MQRSRILDSIRSRKRAWDIVIIGGGATGAGCALDAASRGFDVLLLEQHDFGKGTSSRSTKLIHGGVRYLRQGNISLVREALRERAILLKNAPHVVHKQAFVIPCYSLWQKLFYGFGMKVYDWLAGRHKIGTSRMLSKTETLEHLPSIKENGLAGGVLYFDGQFDDTRLLIDVLRTAEKHGAVVLNYAKVSMIGADETGRLTHLTFNDAETGERIGVSAKAFINATGIFSDTVRRTLDDRTEKTLKFSQGIHIVLERKFLQTGDAIMIPKTSDGRVLFCIPWHDHVLVGTTDTPVETAELEPKALEAEIDFVLETAGKYLSERPTRNDILSVFAGIRPLIKGGAGMTTSSLSRGHRLFVDASGLITITGGKWTTYRRMAEDAVNKAASIGNLSAAGCKTENVHIDASTTSEPGSEQVHPDLPYTRDDVLRAITDEMSRTVEDVLARRTRALFLNARAAIQMSPEVAEIMSLEMSKDEAWVAEQIKAFADVARNYSVRDLA